MRHPEESPEIHRNRSRAMFDLQKDLRKNKRNFRNNFRTQLSREFQGKFYKNIRNFIRILERFTEVILRDFHLNSRGIV